MPFFLPQFLLASFAFWAPRSLWDWSNNTCCKGGQSGSSWAQLAIQESTGPDGMLLRALKEMKHCGDQGRFLITGKMPVSHPSLRTARIQVAASLSSVPQKITEQISQKPLPYCFTKGDSGTVDKEGEGSDCCTLWLQDGLWLSLLLRPWRKTQEMWTG